MNTTFLQYFFSLMGALSPVLLSLLFIILALGFFVGRVEAWSPIDSFYWALVTASTVGYGDFRPTKKLSKIIAMVIIFCGIVITAIIAALGLEAIKRAVEITSFHHLNQ